METRHPDNGRFRHLRFSPDGRYVLAADDGSVAVISTSPFALLRCVSAQNVRFCGFRNGSAEIWYLIDEEYIGMAHQVRLHPRGRMLIERWSILTGGKIGSLPMPACDRGSDAVSPDGGTYVCVSRDGTLRAYDADNSEVLFEKTNFGKQLYAFIGDSLDTVEVGERGAARFTFSQDGRYLIAQPAAARGNALAWDRLERRPIELHGELRGRHKSTFIDPAKVLIAKVEGSKPVAAKLVTFPEGDLLERPLLPPGPVYSLSDPGFALVKPFGRRTTYLDTRQRAAAVELKTGRVIISETPVLDVLGSLYIAELTNGDLGLYEIGKGLKATVRVREQ